MVGRNPGEDFTQDQSVHLIGGPVGVGRFEIIHVAYHRILKCDPVCTEDPPALPTTIKCGRRIVKLTDAHLLGTQWSATCGFEYGAGWGGE